MLSHHSSDCLTTLLIGHLSHRTGIDQTDVRRLPSLNCSDTQLLKHFSKGGSLGKVQLTSKRKICSRFALKGRSVYHLILSLLFNMFASTKVLLFSQNHQFLAIFRVCANLHEILTFHNQLIYSDLRKSYKNYLKKNKKNDTTY